MKDNISILVWAVGCDYSDSSGGVIALHKLADRIALAGIPSYILTGNTFNGSAATVVHSISNLDMDKTMVVYPEIVNGNPLGAKYVTRWLLNTPGVIGGNGIYDSTDLVYKYADCFSAPSGVTVDGTLLIFEPKFDIFFNKNEQRAGECFLVKKGRYKSLNQHGPNSINIDHFPGDQALSDIFNKCEYFICYDPTTYHCVQAALCGCIPIVIPDEGLSKEEFRQRLPFYKYGVAYGFDDIQHARETQHLVAKNLLDLQKDSSDQLIQYLEACHSKIIKSI
jgi:hypothetical protein